MDDGASTDIRPVLSGGGSSNNIITFAENLLWDPVLGDLHVGSDHGAKTKFVTYREDTSKWVHEPDAPWFANWSGSPLAEHGYRQAIDTGVAVYRRRGGSQTPFAGDLALRPDEQGLDGYRHSRTTVNNWTSVAPGWPTFPSGKAS